MRNKMKCFLGILLAVLMAASTPVTVLANSGSSIADGTISVEDSTLSVVAKNTATNQGYENLQTALEEAASGEVIALTCNTEAAYVIVPANVTLDLNGFVLTASALSCFGHVIDGSADNTGLLKVSGEQILIQKNNQQIPVTNSEGYKFYEVTKFNTRYLEEQFKYVFQPFIEAGAHELIKAGAESSGVTINVRITWTDEQGKRTQDFVYNDELTKTFLGSYNPSTGKYSKMLTLTLKNADKYQDLTFGVVVVSDTRVEKSSEVVVLNPTEDSEEPSVENPGNLKENVTLSSEQASAVVAEGTKLDGETLALTAEEMNETTSDLTLSDGEELLSLNVHVDGVAKDNTVPVLVTIDEIAPEFLNQGNITLYHVENGKTVAMTRVYSLEEVDAHNEYYYDVLTGTITMALASFSEIAVVSDAVNAWNGVYDYSWYTNSVASMVDGDNTTADYTIANADQLAAFGKIVGGMAEYTAEDGTTVTIAKDTFDGQTVRLLADVNLGDAETENDTNKIFCPIGYYYNENYTKEDGTTGVYSTVRPFKGTFDGNGHTISNFYQNTWEINGDYDGNYYKDAMGLFGYVVNGTVKNLTVDNFSSDGEYTPTGVIAAYADGNAAFENIAITNCNPRVYNTGNGGIIGIAGDTSASDDDHITLTNITVDNSNKISALWGSWDVACGGLVGMYRGNVDADGNATGDTISFNNCHVSAQIDVYNDVCANYQYYAYRYAGMIIGSVRHNTTNDEGKTIPNMAGIAATGCTVNYGDWNDYYYCEFEKNSIASYSEDYQFSRVPHSELNFTDSNGNEIVDADERASVTGCKHDHTTNEDKQAVYLPFHQLFTGYSWGVSSVGLEKYSGVVTNLDITEGDQEESVKKFEIVDNVGTTYTTGTTVTIDKLFEAASQTEVAIDVDNVQVTVSPVGDKSTAGGTYAANKTDWKQGTLTFSGMGEAEIIITDYNFCISTKLNVTIGAKQSVEKFETKFVNHEEYLYRVGNQNTVALGSLFEAKDGAEIKDVSVTIDKIDGASGTYTANTSDWTKGTIQFSDAGVVKVTITDNDYCTPTELILEVVDAVNATTATSATSNNVVLLNDISSGFTVSGRYSVYGNGFTLNYTGNGQYLNNGLKQGVVTVSENGTLDNLRIKASIYPTAYLYYGTNALGEAVQSGPSTVEGDKTRYHYQLSAVAAKDNATISNCYIYGGRNNIFVNTGDVTITDSILECGVVANVQIQSNSDHMITFNNVTTIQHQVTPTVGDNPDLVMLGAGVLVGPETIDNPTIVLKGDFKQYNWVNADDKAAVSNTMAQAIIQGALDATPYNHVVNGKTSSNLGIIYMNTYENTVTNETGLPYEHGDVSIKISGNTISGKVYSLQNATAEQIYYDNSNADRGTVNGYYEPQFKYSANLGGQYIENTTDCDKFCYREGDTIYVMFPNGDTKELNLAALVNINKYTGQDLNLTVACTDEDGNSVEVGENGVITLSKAGKYMVKYTVMDELFYDENGAEEEKKIAYSWDIAVEVSLKDNAVPDAYFNFVADNQKMGYYKPLIGNVKQYLPFLAGLQIYDYNGQTAYLRFDGDKDFNKVASVSITEYVSNEAYVEVKLTDGGVINTKFLARADSGGGSTYTGKIKTSNNTLYFVTDSGTSDSTSTTTAAYWYVDYYKFVGNNGVTIQSAQQTFNSTGSSASTPSGSFGTTINYTVTYDANGGNCGQNVGYATSASSAVTLPTPARSGYLFTGWYTTASDGTRVGGAGDSYTPSANITLYAQWGKPSIVTYDANGGSCDVSSAEFSGTALTLPKATFDGKVMSGWYTAATGGNRVGVAGSSYSPTENITLYAQWQDPATVTYDANGGDCDTTSQTYVGTALTLPTPTRNGYNFTGWYTAAMGGTKVGDAGASFSPTANTTLYAQWTGCVVTYNSNGGSCNTTSQTYAGAALTLPTPSRENYTFQGWYTAATDGTKVGGAGASYEPTADITLYAQWEYDTWSCVTPDTLVTLSDGTKKEIQYVTVGEEVLTWNFYTGNYDVRQVSWLVVQEADYRNVLRLCFEDGTELKVISDHGIFDAETNNFIFINEDNVQDYINHSFIAKDGEKYKKIKLIDYEISNEYTTACSILSTEDYNVILEDLFTVTPTHTEYNFFNPFEISEGMKYEEENVKADIEKYGLYMYEEFAEMFTEKQFEELNFEIFKISVAKGLVTYEELVTLFELLLEYQS